MKNPIAYLLLPLALGTLPLAQVNAQSTAVPDLMTYQGYVTDDSNVPLGNGTPTNYNVTFRIYGAATGGTPVWAENQVVTIFNGNFSVLLGNGTPDGGTPHDPLVEVFTDDERYLGITVDTGGTPTEFAPRQRILTNAYAYRAKVAESVTGALTTSAGGNVGIGTASPDTELEVNGTITVNPGTLADPSNGATGGNGERIILWPGSGSQPSYAIGLSTSTLWNSVPSTAGYAWFSGSEEIMTLDKDGDLGIGATNPESPLQIHPNGVSNLMGFENTAGAVKWYLNHDNLNRLRLIPRESAVTFTFDQSGMLAIGSTAEYTDTRLAIAGKARFDDARRGFPAVGEMGGNGTRLVIEPGAASHVPSAIGYQTGTLWYGSVLDHAWYTGTDKRMALFDGGQLRITPSNGVSAFMISANNNSSLWDIIIEDTTYSGTNYDRGGFRMHGGFLDATNGINRGAAGNFARLTNSGAWSAVSDERLKSDITPASHLLEDALAINPVTYRFKSDPDTPLPYLGFTAQNVEKHFPSLVTDDGETKTLNYAGLSTVAIGAIQEQHTIIESQADKIEALESENEKLRKRLERIEAALDLK